MTTTTDREAGGDAATDLLPAPSPLVPHSWIGYRYQLVQRLVIRPHAEVWSARDAHRGEDAEVTVLLPVDADPDARLRFLERAQLLSTLDHPSVASALDYGEGALALPARPSTGATGTDRHAVGHRSGSSFLAARGDGPDGGSASARSGVSRSALTLSGLNRIGAYGVALLGRGGDEGTGPLRRLSSVRPGAPAHRSGRLVVTYVATPATVGVPISQVPTTGDELAVARCLDLVAQAARALDLAHGCGLVHGGIRPSNLFVRHGHRLTVVDLPLGRDPEDPALRPGDAVYQAPELWRPGAVATALSDLYALGVVAFECLTGRHPFDDAEVAAIAVAPWGAQPPELPEHLPADVRWVVAQAMQPDPHRRLKSAAQFADALEGLASRLSAGDVTPTVTLRRLDESTGTGTGGRGPGGRGAGRERSAGTPVLPWLPEGVRGLLARHGRPRGLSARLFTAAAIALVLFAGARVVQAALQPANGHQPNRMVLHMVDAGGNRSAAGPSAAPTRTMVIDDRSAGLATVPDLHRLPLSLARQTLTLVGLIPGRTVPQDSADAVRGTVVGTGPTAGSMVAPGSPVTVYISTGRVRVPDLTGRDLQAAAALLRTDLRVRVRVLWQGDPTAGSAVVLQQNPRNASIPQGGTVTLVARAATPQHPPLPMPDPAVPPAGSVPPSPSGAPTSSPVPTAGPTSSPTADPGPTGAPTPPTHPTPHPTA